jgi:hypothetical protein
VVVCMMVSLGVGDGGDGVVVLVVVVVLCVIGGWQWSRDGGQS